MRVLNTSLYQVFLDTANANPEQTALILNKESYSYQQLKAMVDGLAAYLMDMNLLAGARVIIQSGNTVDTIISFWAALKSGAVPVVISPDLSLEKTQYIIDDSAATHYMGPIPENKMDREHLLYFKAQHPFKYSSNLWQHRLDIDLASIIYTSGSTGDAKGVMLSHHNMLAATQSLLNYLQYQKHDKIISVLPLAFDYGLYQMILAFAVGATLILEQDLLLPTYFLKKIEQQQATVLPAVPSLIALLYDAQKKVNYNLTSIRMVTNTGATLTDNHINYLNTLFPAASIFSMYGLTECKRVSYLPAELLILKPKCVGVAIPNTEIWIENEMGQRQSAHQIGQLVVRGSTVMQGYWNKSESTQKKLKSPHILHTGDYAYLDEEGHLYFCGRMDEMLKNRGVKVSPKEIEDIIYRLESVKEVAVIGLDSLLYGFEICACISLVENATLTREKIRAYCQQYLEKEKIPNQIHLFGILPKSANGKIDKTALSTLLNSNKMAI